MASLAKLLYFGMIAIRLALTRLRVGRPLLILIRPGGLGDVIATLPSVEALRKCYQDRWIVYCTRSEFSEIPRMVQSVNEVLSIRQGDYLASRLAKFFDTRIFNYPDEFPGRTSKKHLVQEMSESVGASLEVHRPFLNVSPLCDEDFQRATGMARDGGIVVVIHVGPTSPVREWSTRDWELLVEFLQHTYSARVIQIGTDRHFLQGTRSVDSIRGVMAKIAESSLVETARLLKSCDLFIGVDSGPLHLAAAVGTPSIGLFGPTNPALRGPIDALCIASSPKLQCQYCHHAIPRLHWDTGCPEGMACMQDLPAEDVMARLRELLPAFMVQ